ncbi:hypothetical protein BYT27DRAFT_7190458, partial [Phlegmacium glaucopus]
MSKLSGPEESTESNVLEIFNIAPGDSPYFNGHVPGVYGPVNGIQGQYANWLGISDLDEPVNNWKRMLTEQGKSDEEI